MAQAVVHAAWGEGPTPITPEHLEGVIEAEVTPRPEQEQGASLVAAAEFLQALAREGLVGSTRLARLREVLGDSPD